MIYCDTSLLVAALTSEVHSHLARPWLLAQQRSALVVSDWTLTEFVNALARKQRRGDLAAERRAAAETAWHALRTELTHVEVTKAHFHRAATLADLAPNGLRAGDALHLAIVLDRQCDLTTLDHDLADAARALGVTVHPV